MDVQQTSRSPRWLYGGLFAGFDDVPRTVNDHQQASADTGDLHVSHMDHPTDTHTAEFSQGHDDNDAEYSDDAGEQSSAGEADSPQDIPLPPQRPDSADERALPALANKGLPFGNRNDSAVENDTAASPEPPTQGHALAPTRKPKKPFLRKGQGLRRYGQISSKTKGKLGTSPAENAESDAQAPRPSKPAAKPPSRSNRSAGGSSASRAPGNKDEDKREDSQ